jgi:uncharacterized membrane protein
MTTTKARPWALLFVVSLALNLFFAGMMTSRFVHRRGADGPGPWGSTELGAEVEPVARKIMQGHRVQMQQRTREAREARKRAMEALSAEPFDAARATAALAEFRSKAAAVEEERNAAIVEIAAALPASQRAQAVRALERRGPRGRMQGRWGGGMPGPSGERMFTAPSAPAEP